MWRPRAAEGREGGGLCLLSITAVAVQNVISTQTCLMHADGIHVDITYMYPHTHTFALVHTCGGPLPPTPDNSGWNRGARKRSPK